ncbi:ribonuclease H-like [Mercenaria mercenaria]|uniref:ribonuclease H-like n=1 Tax=Mercenaria mercenaria TaxID=6596 RepID=UPI00234F095C|nr:ribonuclease H-like [Mercenaria mercenaria]
MAFTDGPCRGSPGPCGAGACILPNTELVELKQPVSKLSSILVGEMVAIKLTLKTILEECKRLQINKLKILSDSQSAIGIVNLGWENKTHKFLSSEILQLWKDLEMAGVDIHLDWTPGHAGISGNETADRLAKEAATEAGKHDR